MLETQRAITSAKDVATKARLHTSKRHYWSPASLLQGLVSLTQSLVSLLSGLVSFSPRIRTFQERLIPLMTRLVSPQIGSPKERNAVVKLGSGHCCPSAVCPRLLCILLSAPFSRTTTNGKNLADTRAGFITFACIKFLSSPAARPEPGPSGIYIFNRRAPPVSPLRGRTGERRNSQTPLSAANR